MVEHNDNEMIVLDDGPFEAWIDGILEQSLVNCYEKEPERFQKEVEEWEKEHGRKIGTASPEEIAYRESAWEPVYEAEKAGY